MNIKSSISFASIALCVKWKFTDFDQKPNFVCKIYIQNLTDFLYLLDFPSVDWVIQSDCPEDAKTYIHRVGRTARHSAVGQSLLTLLPSEKEGMLKQLRIQRIPIGKF